MVSATATDVQRYWSVTEVSKLLRIDPHKVYQWLNSGELQGLNLSVSRNPRKTRIRIADDALQAFLQGRSLGAAPPAAPRRKRKPKPEGITQYF